MMTASLRELLARLVRREGYRVREAGSVREAAVELESGEVAVLIANLRPDQRTRATADFRRTYHPSLKIFEMQTEVYPPLGAQALWWRRFAKMLEAPQRGKIAFSTFYMAFCTN